MNVQDFLSDRKVAYDAIPHRATYDAQRLAQTLHTPGREVAKTVLLRADGGYTYVVAVLPATKTIDFDKVSAEEVLHVLLANRTNAVALDELFTFPVPVRGS